jgi:hypothetical protein
VGRNPNEEMLLPWKCRWLVFVLTWLSARTPPGPRRWLGSLLFTIAAAPLMAELIAPRLIPRVDHFDRNAATLQTLFSRLRPP